MYGFWLLSWPMSEVLQRRVHPVHTVAARSRLRSADHGDLVVPRVLSRFGCRSFRVSGLTIWNDLPVDFRSSDITREQFKRSLKSWLLGCASEGAPKKWTYLLTWWCVVCCIAVGCRSQETRASEAEDCDTVTPVCRTDLQSWHWWAEATKQCRSEETVEICSCWAKPICSSEWSLKNIIKLQLYCLPV